MSQQTQKAYKQLWTFLFLGGMLCGGMYLYDEGMTPEHLGVAFVMVFMMMAASMILALPIALIGLVFSGREAAFKIFTYAAFIIEWVFVVLIYITLIHNH